MDDLFYDTCNYIMDTHLLLASHSSVPASQSAAASVMLASLLYHVSTIGKLMATEGSYLNSIIFRQYRR